MLENKQKGWHGCYSKIGKYTVEQFEEIMKMDQIFKRAYKKIRIKDFFSPDKKINNLNYLDDNLKVFQVYQDQLNTNSTDIKNIKKEKDDNNLIKKNIHKYHDIHIYNEKIKKLKRITSLPCLVYKPKYNLVFSKTITGPIWSKIKGRKIPKIEIDNRDFLYNENNNFLNNKGEFKCLVNMDKNTQRGNFIDLKDVRIRNDKGYIKENFIKDRNNLKLIKKSKNKNEQKNINFNNLSEDKNDEIVFSKQHINLEEKIKNNKNKTLSYSNIKKKNKKRKLKKSKTNLSLKPNVNEIEHNSKNILKPSLSEAKIHGPDLKKNITRKYLEKLKALNSSKFLISYSPKYSFVFENFNSNIKYKKDIKQNISKRKLFIGLEPNSHFDPNKVINKYNNHESINPPDFNLMSSRFSRNNNNTLPCYMQNIFQRGGLENLNQKTLELNECSKTKLVSSKSSFFPKKSFNNIVNLNLINSSIFRNKNQNEEVKEKINMIKNEMSFNHKGLEELIREGALNRFDGITYKSIKKNKHVNMNELLYRANNSRFKA